MVIGNRETAQGKNAKLSLRNQELRSLAQFDGERQVPVIDFRGEAMDKGTEGSGNSVRRTGSR